MKNINKRLNIEGSTYVIPGEAKYNEAKIKTKETGDWNDFVVPEDEANHVQTDVADEKLFKERLERAKAQKIGMRSILGAMLEAA